MHMQMQQTKREFGRGSRQGTGYRPHMLVSADKGETKFKVTSSAKTATNQVGGPCTLIDFLIPRP